MIAKIKRGGGFRGALDYALNEGKKAVEGKDAELIGGNMSGTNSRDLAEEFKTSRELRPEVSRPVWTESLRPAEGDTLTDEQWLEVAHSHMQQIGLDPDKHMHVIVKHHDHIHIVASRIAVDASLYHGKNENLIASRDCRRIEREYGLTRVKPDMAKSKSLTKNEVEMAKRTSEEPPRERIQRVVTEAAKTCTDMAQFRNALATEGIEYRRSGLGVSYAADGIAFKASQLGTDFSAKNIENRIEQNRPELVKPQPESHKITKEINSLYTKSKELYKDELKLKDAAWEIKKQIIRDGWTHKSRQRHRGFITKSIAGLVQARREAVLQKSLDKITNKVNELKEQRELAKSKVNELKAERAGVSVDELFKPAKAEAKPAPEKSVREPEKAQEPPVPESEPEIAAPVAAALAGNLGDEDLNKIGSAFGELFKGGIGLDFTLEPAPVQEQTREPEPRSIEAIKADLNKIEQQFAVTDQDRVEHKETYLKINNAPIVREQNLLRPKIESYKADLAAWKKQGADRGWEVGKPPKMFGRADFEKWEATRQALSGRATALQQAQDALKTRLEAVERDYTHAPQWQRSGGEECDLVKLPALKAEQNSSEYRALKAELHQAFLVKIEKESAEKTPEQERSRGIEMDL